MKLRSILYPLTSLLVLTTGCIKETKPAAEVNRAPLIVDEAMQQRQWNRSVARIQNGETPATPTEFIWQHPQDTPKWVPVITDGPLFLLNVFSMPVAFVFTPPTERVIYPSGVVEPSYTAVPPTK